MIPQIIHQIWVGDQSKRPQELMDTWKITGWEYRLWTEAEIAPLLLKNAHHYDFYMKHGVWHGASDIVRVELLERFGGVYIDADTRKLKDITDTSFMQSGFFAVQANHPNGVSYPTRIANGIMGSVPNHPIVKKYREEMGKATKITPPWSTIGGTLLTDIIYRYRTKDTTILEPHTFYPFDSKGRASKTKGESYGQHLWGTTHDMYGSI